MKHSETQLTAAWYEKIPPWRLLNVGSTQLKEQKEDQLEGEMNAADPWLESDPWQTALKDSEDK